MNEIFLQLIRVGGLAVVAFLGALAIAPVWFLLVQRFRLGKHIRSGNTPIFQALHLRKAGTPTMGGVVFWATTLVLAFGLWVMSSWFDEFWAFLNFVNRRETYLPLAALALSAALGALDDVLGVLRIGPAGGGIGVKEKLIITCGLALLGAWWFVVKLGITSLPVPFLGLVKLGIWYIPFFLFFLLATTLSANETDGLDGLLGGIMLFAFFPLVVIAFLNGDYNLATFGAVLLGSLAGFLWFNIFPAQFFMGDTGSLPLGVTFALMALITGVPLLVPLFGFVLVAESGSVIIQTVAKKLFRRKVFHSTPFHHHFEALGILEPTIVMRFWIVNAFAALVGLMVYLLDRLV